MDGEQVLGVGDQDVERRRRRPLLGAEAVEEGDRSAQRLARGRGLDRGTIEVAWSWRKERNRWKMSSLSVSPRTSRWRKAGSCSARRPRRRVNDSTVPVLAKSHCR
jgi:hypothetical protein